jgi:hypothetical protein
MTRPGHDGTGYRAQPESHVPRQGPDGAAEPVPAQPRVTVTGPGQAAVLPAVPAAPVTASGTPSTTLPPAAEPDLWSTRATTTRGMIGRPTSRAALAAAGAAATDAVGIATSTIPDVATRAAEVVPDPPRPGTLYGRPQADRSGKVLSGRMARLHIGWHTASVDAVSMIRVPSAGTGLVIGADRYGRGVPVRFFRPEPTRVTLLGGDWATAVLVFRALALGANVSVWTDDPQRWRGLGERAAAAANHFVVNAERVMLPPATPQQPLLSITDDGSAGPLDASERRAWHTELTVLHQLDERGVPAIQDSNLVIAQRLGPVESALIASALRLPGFVTAPLQQIDDETVALLGPADPQYVRVNATDVERGMAGSARR